MPFLVANFHNWDSDGEMILQLLVFLHGFTTSFFLTPFEAVRFAVIRFKPCSWDDGSDPLRCVHNHVLLACLGGRIRRIDWRGLFVSYPNRKKVKDFPMDGSFNFPGLTKKNLKHCHAGRLIRASLAKPICKYRIGVCLLGVTLVSILEINDKE